jgi:pyrroloquinoline-quinone synthase
MSDLIQKIDTLIEEQSLLKHPFYQTWSEGKLTHDALAGYAKEYFQMVKAVPRFMTPLLDTAPESMYDELDFNQNEETDHIKLWIKFANALEISTYDLESYKGLDKTTESIEGLFSMMYSFDIGSAAMYALEKEIPKISQTKLEGLAEYYDLTTSDATVYLEQHTEADVRHAESWKNAIDTSSNTDEVMIKAAQKSLSCQNLLLDGCFETYC